MTETNHPPRSVSRRFGIILLLGQVIFIGIFAVLGQYTPAGDALLNANGTLIYDLPSYYPMFQDVHVMIFIGFGFLMTFLKKYGYSSVGINFILAAFVLQWAMILYGIFHSTNGKIAIGITSMINADFAAGAVLISMGAMLGKLTPEQYIIMGFVEIALYCGNEFILTTIFKINDAGGSIIIHAFGAYFGLACARAFYKKDHIGHKYEGAIYHSDLFSMIGTVFLWLYWPSFNGAVVPEDQQYRAVINTYISLAACCVAAFACSAMFNSENKLEMVHVQNATLAGGVAMGTSANLMVAPFVAAIIGAVAGIISTGGYKYLQGYLASTINLHDTCGVNNLHGMPAIFAALLGILFSFMASESNYGHNLYIVFPERLNGRTASSQAMFQAAALGCTLGIAIVGGAATGYILKANFWSQIESNDLFLDDPYWDVAPYTDEEPTFIDVVPVQEMSSFPTQNVKTAKTREIKTAQSYDLKPMHMNDIVKPVSTPPPKTAFVGNDLDEK